MVVQHCTHVFISCNENSKNFPTVKFMPYVTSAVRPSTFGGARVRKSAADRPTQPDVGGQWDTCGDNGKMDPRERTFYDSLQLELFWIQSLFRDQNKLYRVQRRKENRMKRVKEKKQRVF